jgi:hypothetical protein
MSWVRRGALALIVALAGSVAACGDDGTGPDAGSIRIRIDKTGAGDDADGFQVSLDGGAPVNVAAGQSTVFEDVPRGTHTVTLSGLAPKCTPVSGLTSWTLATSAGREVAAVFAVNCT